MATRKRKSVVTSDNTKVTSDNTNDTTIINNISTVTSNENTTSEIKSKTKIKSPKYLVGSIVYISKEAEADLNGFKLFPQYKKYTYTVEAYDAITGVYSLRRLNLLLKLKEADIIAPNERAHDSLNRRQF